MFLFKHSDAACGLMAEKIGIKEIMEQASFKQVVSNMDAQSRAIIEFLAQGDAQAPLFVQSLPHRAPSRTIFFLQREEKHFHSALRLRLVWKMFDLCGSVFVCAPRRLIDLFAQRLCDAEQWLHSFRCDTDVIHLLHTCADARLKEQGYLPARGTGRIIHLFVCAGSMPKDGTNAVALSYSKLCDLENETTISLTESYFSNRMAYGTVFDGKLVSIAAINPLSSYDQQYNSPVRDLCCETIPNYRKRGYAYQNVAALISALQHQKLFPIYRCYSDNMSSVHLAKKLSLQCVARVYHASYQQR